MNATPPDLSNPDAVDDPLEFQVLNEIGIIDQLAQSSAARLLAPDMNMSQFVVLNHFVRLGGERSLVQLASVIQVTKGAMTNTVARLKAKGWVSVKPDPNDGRGKLVSLTAAGRSVRNSAVAKLAGGLAGLNGVAGRSEFVAVLKSLRKLRVWFDGNR